MKMSKMVLIPEYLGKLNNLAFTLRGTGRQVSNVSTQSSKHLRIRDPPTPPPRPVPARLNDRGMLNLSGQHSILSKLKKKKLVVMDYIFPKLRSCTLNSSCRTRR